MTVSECYELIEGCTLDEMHCDGINIVIDKSKESSLNP